MNNYYQQGKPVRVPDFRASSGDPSAWIKPARYAVYWRVKA